jgi:hypothetical protein
MSSNKQPEFRSGLVLNPDKFYSPSYRISPFRTEDVAANLQLRQSDLALKELDRRFAGRKWCFTESGKEGIALALEALALKSGDCITILTTSGNFYISGCVTREIEKVCNWSREIQDNTTALFVNHEFGYPYRNLSELRRYGLPIIEDACHSYLADTSACDMGRVGDFIIFSLPKIFPLQIGGVLSFDPSYNLESRIQRGGEQESYITKVMSHYIPELEITRERRLANYFHLAQLFATLGCYPRFELLPNDVPGVFIFTLPMNIDLAALKEHVIAHGIECSVFYGENAFFIPVHQRLCEDDLAYFHSVFSSFIARH